MAFFSMMRPLNGLLAGLSVALGYFLCTAEAGVFRVHALWFAALSAFFISGFGNVINDVLDLEPDKRNRPGRALPSGRVTPAAARRFSILLLLIGLILARAVSLGYLCMAFGVALLLFLYSARLKSTVLWGNIAVAFLTGFTLVYGGLLTRDPRGAVLPALFAFLVNLIREIVKDMEDAEGDALSGVVTLPLRHGEKMARTIAIFLAVLLLACTYFPYYAGIYGRRYLWLVTVLVNLPLMGTAFLLCQGRLDKKMLGRLSAALKWIMLAGFASILLGRGGPLCGFAFSA